MNGCKFYFIEWKIKDKNDQRVNKRFCFLFICFIDKK